MPKIKSMLIKILLYLWQIPQHVLALIIWGVLRITRRVWRVKMLRGHKVIQTFTPGWGVSLGDYIFFDTEYNAETVKHELGHSVQSRQLGPLYLPVIGIASAVCNNLWDRLFHRKWPVRKRVKWYYSRFPEKQADILGGVQRVHNA